MLTRFDAEREKSRHATDGLRQTGRINVEIPGSTSQNGTMIKKPIGK
jgi:hypothetical protein